MKLKSLLSPANQQPQGVTKMAKFNIESYKTSTGTEKVKLTGTEVTELFETVETTEVSGVILLNGTHLARSTNKVKPVEIKGNSVLHEILVTKNNREVETIVSVEVDDCKLFAEEPKIVEMQGKSVKETVTDLANKARENQLTEEEKAEAVEKALKSLQLQGVELETIERVINNWQKY